MGGARIDDERDDVRVGDRLLGVRGLALDQPPVATRQDAAPQCPQSETAADARQELSIIARRAGHVADEHTLFVEQRLTSDDLPTLGLPTIATLVSRAGGSG